MESTIRRYQKQKDYQRHKLFRKIKRRRDRARQAAIDQPIKELKRRMRQPSRFDGGKDNKNHVTITERTYPDGTVRYFTGDTELEPVNKMDTTDMRMWTWQEKNNPKVTYSGTGVKHIDGEVKQGKPKTTKDRVMEYSNAHYNDPVLGAPARWRESWDNDTNAVKALFNSGIMYGLPYAPAQGVYDLVKAGEAIQNGSTDPLDYVAAIPALMTLSDQGKALRSYRNATNLKQPDFKDWDSSKLMDYFSDRPDQMYSHRIGGFVDYSAPNAQAIRAAENNAQNFLKSDVYPRFVSTTTRPITEEDRALFGQNGFVQDATASYADLKKSKVGGWFDGDNTIVANPNLTNLDRVVNHEYEHLQRDRLNTQGLLNDFDFTDSYINGYTPDEHSALNRAYKFGNTFSDKLGRIASIKEKGATNREMRYAISKAYNKTGKELDDVIDNMPEEELEKYLKNTNGYSRDFLNTFHKNNKLDLDGSIDDMQSQMKRYQDERRAFYNNIRKALKYVPAVGGAVVVSNNKESFRRGKDLKMPRYDGGKKAGYNVEYMPEADAMRMLANNMGKTAVLDEVTVTPSKKLPMQSDFYEGETNQAANERADEFANRTSLTPERFLGMMGGSALLSAGALGTTVYAPVLADYIAGTKAGQAITRFLANPYFNAALDSGFIGHGLYHSLYEGIDGPLDAAMTALEMSPLTKLAKPVLNAATKTLSDVANRYVFIPRANSFTRGIGGEIGLRDLVESGLVRGNPVGTEVTANQFGKLYRRNRNDFRSIMDSTGRKDIAQKYYNRSLTEEDFNAIKKAARLYEDPLNATPKPKSNRIQIALSRGPKDPLAHYSNYNEYLSQLASDRATLQNATSLDESGQPLAYFYEGWRNPVSKGYDYAKSDYGVRINNASSYNPRIYPGHLHYSIPNAPSLMDPNVEVFKKGPFGLGVMLDKQTMNPVWRQDLNNLPNSVKQIINQTKDSFAEKLFSPVRGTISDISAALRKIRYTIRAADSRRYPVMDAIELPYYESYSRKPSQNILNDLVKNPAANLNYLDEGGESTVFTGNNSSTVTKLNSGIIGITDADILSKDVYENIAKNRLPGMLPLSYKGVYVENPKLNYMSMADGVPVIKKVDPSFGSLWEQQKITPGSKVGQIIDGNVFPLTRDIIKQELSNLGYIETETPGIFRVNGIDWRIGDFSPGNVGYDNFGNFRIIDPMWHYNHGKSKIHIKPSKRGTFTAAARNAVWECKSLHLRY